MKKLMTTLLLMTFGLFSYSQHVPTLKPTNERLTKVKSTAVKEFETGLENFKINKYPEAKKNFQNAISEDQSFAEAYINLSKIYEIEGDLNAAKEVLQNAISSMIPLNERAFLQLGIVSYKMKDFDAAEYNFKQAVSLNNQESDYHYFAAVSLVKLYKYEEALVFFKKASELNASNRNQIGLSNGQILNNKNEDAISTLKSLSSYESNPEACLNIAIAYHNLGNGDETDKFLQMAASNGAGDQAEFQNLSGLILSEKENHDEAKAAFDKAISLDNENATYYNDRASHLIRSENFKDALTDLNKAIELKPDFSRAYFNRGISKEMLRDEQGACLDWEYAFFLGYAQAEELLNNPICNK